MTSGELQFAAFLSYSRKDVRLARWLVRALEEFRLPRQTVDDLKARSASFVAARPIFRDEHDMPVGGVISERLGEMLDASATMIVLCTGSSAKSDWVNKEIALFASRHPDRRIIPAVAEGEPDSDDSYPPALLKLGKPLAADLRNPSERHQSVIKIAAAVLGLDVDQLVGRVQKHRVEQRRWLAAGGAAAAAVVVGLGVTASVMANSAKRANNLARDQVELLLTSTREEVQAAGLLSARSAVLAAAEGYFDGKRPGELTDKDLLLNAKLLRQKGEDAAARGDTEAALDLCKAAFVATEELLSRDENNPDRLFEHGQSAYWVGDLHWRQAENEKARRYFEIYLRSAERLVEVRPDYPNAALEVGYANANLGRLTVEQFRDPRGASALFSKALAVIEPRATDIKAKENLSVLYAYQTQAMAQFEDGSKVIAMIARWNSLLSELDETLQADRNLSLDVANHLNLLGEFERRAGRRKKGDALIARALAVARDQLKTDPDNEVWRSFALGLNLKSAIGSPACENSQFEFGDVVDAHRAHACIRRSGIGARDICGKFITWLDSQKPNFRVEHLWAAILGQCSRSELVSADERLPPSLDQLVERFFFSREIEGFSFWTQIELANFKSVGRNATRVTRLKKDLERRGWNVDQS